MKINWWIFLNKTRLRDGAVFLAVTMLITLLLNYTVFVFMPLDFHRLVLSLVIISQFYLAAFISLPIRSTLLRRLAYGAVFIFNFFVFRELIYAFSTKSVSGIFDLEAIIIVLFLLSLFSRSIRMYFYLREQLVLLNHWTQRKILFKKSEDLTLNMGREGEMVIHPNELVYVRTKAAGDHTKIFGIKPRQPKGVNARLSEHETTTYRNFDQVLRLLKHYPQFKKVHTSAIINTTYPFKAREGVLNIEGRRFKVGHGDI